MRREMGEKIGKEGERRLLTSVMNTSLASGHY